jgi:hypothetical protein
MSNELSSPSQQLFLTNYGERSYFKGYGHLLIKTEKQDTWPHQQIRLSLYLKVII